MIESENKVEKCLKLELAFDEAATDEINRQKVLSKVGSTEELLIQALRVHGWYLDNQQTLFVRQGEELLKVTLEL
jgi:hypothetical protein